MAEAYIPRLKQAYDSQIRATLKEEFGYTNDLQIPRLEKVVLNMGVGEAVADSRKIKTALGEMEKIAGQKPIVTKARRSIAGFKLRQGMVIGCKVTLRRSRMYEFIDRLITIALPRVKDFRGLSKKSLDGNGNFAMGIREQLVFPEIAYDDIDDIRGMDVVVCTTARTDTEAKFLLAQCGFPFRN